MMAEPIRFPVPSVEHMRRARESLEFARRMGALDDLPAKLAMIEATLKAVPADQLQRASRLIAAHWEGVQAFARLALPQREACAEHLIRVGGVSVADQAGFLTETGQNLNVFGENAGTSDAVERAALLAGSVLAADRSTDLQACHPSNVAAVQRYEEQALAQLEADYARERNPLFAFEALILSRAAGDTAPPEWVMRYFTDSAAVLMELVKNNASRNGDDESERVGKALGFGVSGPGRGKWFERASILTRDRAIYVAVKERLAIRRQLTASYHDVATAMKISGATVGRSYRRMDEFVKIGRSFATKLGS